MKRAIAIAAFTLLSNVAVAAAEQRLPTIPPAQYTEDQKKAAADFLAARKTPVFGPFEALMHSPEVMTQARSMGDYLRFRSSLGNTLSELVILITARQWTQDFEWQFHYPIALKAGIRKEIADAIADGRRPTGMSEDEEIVYDFSTELHTSKRVSDATFARADKRFGKRGVVDLTGINAYYTLLAMQMNVARYQAPSDVPKLTRFPE
ncbi:carboxymuconolactone decarboxylase family protein [Rhodopseudomonas sp. P2A-2r]|uniref:carboxymuconolactone decarboxylase family protein n=1 Tax=unclassified Rhodopseudomonas TaxID=2638247 RepID=UPI0022349ACE|nr:carboxymuconolactone decarboxylase family protein [Rhodopseudomonas sp. P2A-2r]UZE51854.1 carboxymuconolactone decarboxylase family protein [Rhodopseudomonas sp. P2A-2r]